MKAKIIRITGILAALLTAAFFFEGCSSQIQDTDVEKVTISKAEKEAGQGVAQEGKQTETQNEAQTETQAVSIAVPARKTENEPYAIKTTLREVFSVDPKKGVGVYGRYTVLTAGDDAPQTLLSILEEVNSRAKETVEAEAARFIAENKYPAIKKGSAYTERYRYRNISYIVNVSRADDVLFSILETRMESGIGDRDGERIDPYSAYQFHSAVYDTKSGRPLALSDFLKKEDSLHNRLRAALVNKYSYSELYTGSAEETPAWTADYLGLRFYIDGDKTSEEERREHQDYSRSAVQVSIPYTALDGDMASAAAVTPKSFIAALEKNTDYQLPHDSRIIRIEKAKPSYNTEEYRIVIKDGKNKEFWWLEYADDDSDFFVFRTEDKYYFYRLEDNEDRAYVYDFASPDGGFERFANQNAQVFDSFMKELYVAVPYNPECVHMREKTRTFMNAVSGMSTTYIPNGHYSFLPERGRGRTWLHFALIDDVLMLDSHNVSCRLLHELSAKTLGNAGEESGETVIPAGEVLTFRSVSGEGELYFYMSTQYQQYQSGARDYTYDCVLSDGTRVRIVTPYENSFFVEGMYLDRIGEPVTTGAARYEAGLGEIPEHYVEIGGKEYRLIRDLSNKTESGEEIDFGEDIWWEVENYVGTFSSEEEDAELVISEDGSVRFTYDGKEFTGSLPEKRYYNKYVHVYLESGYERRTFSIIVEDDLPPHDPSFTKIRFYSEGLPATNEPSKVPPIEVDLVRE